MFSRFFRVSFSIYNIQAVIIYFSDVHRFDSSSVNADEFRRIKSLMIDLQEELGNAIVEHMGKFDSIEPMVTDLQSQLSQMETS